MFMRFLVQHLTHDWGAALAWTLYQEPQVNKADRVPELTEIIFLWDVKPVSKRESNQQVSCDDEH